MSTITFDQLWQSDYAPQVREKIARRAEQRSEAFLDCTITVAGEEIRQMTPEDLLMLDGFGSPFVCAPHGTEATLDEIKFFIWQLHPTNNHTGSFLNFYRKGLVEGRLARRGEKLDGTDQRSYGKITEEIWTFCRRMFSDLETPEEERAGASKPEAFRNEPRSYFLAPLLVSIASEIGHCDPMSGRLLSQTPLPRLLQYQLATRPEHDRGDEEVRALRFRCNQRVNEINWLARQANTAE